MNKPDGRQPIPLLTGLSAIWLTLAGLASRAVLLRYAEFLAKGRIVPSFLAIGAALLLGTLFVFFLIWAPGRIAPLKEKAPILSRGFAALITAAPLVLYGFLPWSEPFGAFWIRAYLFALTILAATWLSDREKRFTAAALVRISLIFSVSALVAERLQTINNYPFSVGWSEGNRFWDYSVLFGRRLYDWRSDGPIPAYIDLGRQGLWGAIFLLPKVTITMMRAWNAVLFTVPYLLLGWALLRKQGNPESWERNAALPPIVFTMLFLNQGPIYTPLVLAIALAAAARKTPRWVQLPLLMAAGAFAVLSRSTWIIAPPVLAAAIDFVESSKPVRTRWLTAFLLAAAALLGAALYLSYDNFLPRSEPSAAPGAAVSSAPPGSAPAETQTEPNGEEAPPMFTREWVVYSLTRQPLILSRLFPNETFAPGILLALLIAVLPLIALLTVWDRERRWRIDRLTRGLIALMLTGFCAVGLLISVKIGGGSNLHNLDMFLIALLVVAALAWNDGFGGWARGCVRGNRPVSLLIAATILIPTVSIVFSLTPKRYPDAETTRDALEKIQAAIEAADGEDVLFIDQRQLLTFGSVPRTELIADYEKKWMMDEAMANNAEWFAPYYMDLKARRFRAIISEPLQVKFQGADLNFSEENDLFVRYVSVPTLCYYEPAETFPEQGVQILIPRAEPIEIDGFACP